MLHPEEYLLDKYRDVHEELTDEKAVAVEESRKRNADKYQYILKLKGHNDKIRSQTTC